ncbi:hypothetical protein BTJ44_00623 [Bacillus mycoides]|nr:hypothetical protein BTJ44_00623 [Bacillus mycoides]
MKRGLFVQYRDEYPLFLYIGVCVAMERFYETSISGHSF